MQDWLAQRARARAAHRRARDPRRRGGDPARRPRRRALATAGARDRPSSRSSSRARVRAPTPRVVALRERALRARCARRIGARGERMTARRAQARRALAGAACAARARAARRLGAVRRTCGRRRALVLPAPHAVASALWNNAGFLGGNFASTAEEVVLGLALALALRLRARGARSTSRRCCAAPCIRSRSARRRCRSPVIAPLLVFWWGFGVFPKLVVIVLICFFPVVVTTVDGLAAVDPDQLKLLRTLDASRWQAFRFAELPAALPAALSGARIALAVGVIGAFIAETRPPTSGAYAGPRARDQRRPDRPADAARVRCRRGAVRIRDRLLLRPRPRRAPAGAVGEPTERRHPLRAHAAAPPMRVARRSCWPSSLRARAVARAAPSRT